MAKAREGILPSSEAGILALLLGASLVVLASDVMMSSLYPALAVHYGVPLETVVLLSTPRALAQLGALVLGPLSERMGRARLLVGGLFLAAAAAWGGALARDMGAMVLVQVAMGLALAVANAGIPALVGDRYPYAVRGRALAIVRLAMPLSLIVAAPALVSLSSRAGVVAPFVALGAAATAIAGLAAWRLPTAANRAVETGVEGTAHAPAAPDLLASVAVQSESSTAKTGSSAWAQGPIGRLRALCVSALNRRRVPARAMAILGLALCMSLVPQALFTFLPAWVGGTFGNPGVTVSIVLSCDGAGALLGVAVTVLSIDRLTKRRAGALGLVAAGAFLALLPATAGSFILTCATIACLSASLEMVFVAFPALLSGLAPRARGTVMGLWAAALAVGGALAPVIGRLLWMASGMDGIGRAGGAMLVVVAVVLMLVAVEPEDAAPCR